jgi:integrase
MSEATIDTRKEEGRHGNAERGDGPVVASPPLPSPLSVSPLSLPRPPRPNRPKNFPLFPHRCGQWAKKVRGRMLYFGPWKQTDLALARWEAWKIDLLAGRPVRAMDGAGTTLKQLCNDFLTTKKGLEEEGAITARTWQEYKAACTRLCTCLGKETPVSQLVPADFEKLRSTLAKTWGPVRLGNEIRRVRTIFRHGLIHKLIDELPSYGTSFQKPSKQVLRKARAEKGPRMFEPEQLHKLLAAANPTLKAFILLGVNCGLGNTDLARMQKKHLDLKTGWMTYPRPKTGMQRRAKLWPETIAAIKEALKARRETKPGAPGTPGRGSRKLLFLTSRGRSWHLAGSGDLISNQMHHLTAQRCKIWRPGLGFYALRHTFETIGGEAKDQAAVDFVMGHPARQGDMSAEYRERMLDARLAAVADHVHAWLFGQPDAEKKS